MGHQFLHEVLVEEQDPAADAILTHELPVNPVSMLLLHIKPLNETGTITTYEQLAAILDALNDVRVRWRGVDVLQMRGRDLYQYIRHHHHIDVVQNGLLNTNDVRRSIVIPIPFGRHLGDAEWALPATKQGELVLTLDIDVAAAGYDDFRYGIEAISLPGATPRSFLRATTIATTLSATGNQDIELNVGHDILGILCFQTTAHTGATPAPGLGRISILKDGIAVGYQSTDVEVARILAVIQGMPRAHFDEHTHFGEYDPAADADTEPWDQTIVVDDHYIYLPFDLDGTGRYNLDTKGAGRLVLRTNAEQAEAMRIIPIEQVPVSIFQ